MSQQAEPRYEDSDSNSSWEVERVRKPAPRAEHASATLRRGPDGRVLPDNVEPDYSSCDEYANAFSDGTNSDVDYLEDSSDDEDYGSDFSTPGRAAVREELRKCETHSSYADGVGGWDVAEDDDDGLYDADAGRGAPASTAAMRREMEKQHAILDAALAPDDSEWREDNDNGTAEQQQRYGVDERHGKRQRVDAAGRARTSTRTYDEFWSRFKLPPEQSGDESGASTDERPAKSRLFEILNGDARKAHGAQLAGSDDPDTPGRRVRILAPMQPPYADDTFSVTFDPTSGVMGDDANARLYAMLNCDVNGFIEFEDQFTTVRGVLETQQQMLVDLTMRHEVERRALNAEVQAFDDEQALRDQYARQEHALDLQDFVTGTSEIDVYRDRLETLGAKPPSAKHMNPDRSFVPAKSPMLARLDDIRNARLRADGLSDIVRAMATCPICRHAGAANSTPDMASPETIALYSYWSEVSAMTCKEIPWQVMAEYWNDQFVKPFTEQNRKPPVPELKPSHMDIHFTECLTTNIIPALVRHAVTLREAEQRITDNGVFTEERVAGKSTGKISLSKNGFSVYTQILRLQHRVQKDITNYSMAARLLQGTAAAPLAGMLCQQKQLNLNTFLKLRPKKNEHREENASRVMGALLGNVKR
jgi:hypothetical protein